MNDMPNGPDMSDELPDLSTSKIRLETSTGPIDVPVNALVAQIKNAAPDQHEDLLRHLTEAISSHCDSIARAIASLRQEIQQIRQEIASLRQEGQQTRQEIASLRQESQQTQQEIASLRQEGQQTQQMINDLRGSVEGLHARMSSTRSEPAPRKRGRTQAQLKASKGNANSKPDEAGEQGSGKSDRTRRAERRELMKRELGYA